MTAPTLEKEIARLQDAIASLEARRAQLGDLAVDTSIAALCEKLSDLTREPVERQRKLVTVLFADLVGFTPLAESLDPEDVRDLLEGYFEPWREAVARFGGRLEKYIGDAVMAVFGVPVATEADAEKAIRAALLVRDGLPRLNVCLEERFGVRLAMRVGIHTGPVLVAEAAGAGDLAVTGDTVNLASRLEGLAPPNGILISHDTYRHVRGAFDVEVQPPLMVKGRAEPVLTYRVARARPRAFHRGLHGVEGVETRMIGRQAELRRLQDALLSIAQGGPQLAITVIGEAGVGKSRLLFEFENWADVLPQRFLLFKGRAGHDQQGMPYALIRDLLAFRFQIQDSDPPETVQAKLERGFAEALGEGGQAEVQAHFVGHLLGLGFGDSRHLREALGDARQIRDRALVYLDGYFRAMTERLPAVVLLEDLHWADDSSLDLLDGLSLSLAGRPLLIVGLARPSLLERRPKWGDERACQRRIELGCLSEQESQRLIEEILRTYPFALAGPLPEALSKLVAGRAEGNPFYIEELIKMLIEDGVIVAGPDAWRVEAGRLGGAPVPPTLAGVLQARIDRLAAEDRAVLQRASVVGRRFWDRAVAHLGEAPRGAGGRGAGAGIGRSLAAIQAREMVFRQPASAFAGAEEYLFIHALLRDVAYEGVLKRVRRVYHALAAEWLEEQGGERAGEYCGLIADHLEAAGETQRALPYLRRAGEQAAGRFANAEAASYFSRALALTPEGDLPGRYGLLLRREAVYHLLGERKAQAADLAALQSLAEALGDACRRARAALRQARYGQAISDRAACIAAAQVAIGLATGPEDAEIEAEALLLWGEALTRQGDYQAALPLLEKAVVLARAQGDLPAQALGLLRIGSVCWCQSDFSQAAANYRQSLALCRETGDRRGEGAALNNLGVILWDLGVWDQSQECFEEVIRIQHDIGDRLGEARSLSNLAGLTVDRGELSEAQAYCGQALDLARQIGSRLDQGLVLSYVASIAAMRGDFAGAVASVAQALDIHRAAGDRQMESGALHNLGTYCLALGEFRQAGAHLVQALAVARSVGLRRQEAACRLTRGRLLLTLGDYPTARESYEASLGVGREIGDNGLEAYARYGLALLQHQQGDDEAALEGSGIVASMAKAAGRRTMLAQALALRGSALEGLGHADEAAAAFREALEMRQAIGQPHLAAEVSAGLARLALAQGDLAGAQARVEQILDHLETGALHGTDEPFRIYLTCTRVLQAAQDPRAAEVLATAHALLQEQAATIDDMALKRSFLEQVEAHRELAREFTLAQPCDQAGGPAPSPRTPGPQA